MTTGPATGKAQSGLRMAVPTLSPGQPDDRAILCGLRRRDAKALEQVTVRFGAALLRAAFVYLGDRHEAEDMAQETLVQAWDAAPRAADDTRMKPWLMGILMNQCRKHRRSLWRRLRREKHAAESRPVIQRPEEDGQERMAALQSAMARLDDDLRAVVILRYQNGLGVPEAAEALGIPEGTVKSRCHAACQRLRLWMEQSHDTR
jgi:RNA polymerase sigma-70 factor, ECF subfamily